MKIISCSGDWIVIGIYACSYWGLGRGCCLALWCKWVEENLKSYLSSLRMANIVGLGNNWERNNRSTWLNNLHQRTQHRLQYCHTHTEQHKQQGGTLWSHWFWLELHGQHAIREAEHTVLERSCAQGKLRKLWMWDAQKIIQHVGLPLSKL